MEDKRGELHEVLCCILGSRNVYFQPPESIRMCYPAIVYSLDSIYSTHADGGVYASSRRYAVTIIDEDPDTPFVGRMSSLPMCKFDRYYGKDNLNHYVFKLYF